METPSYGDPQAEAFWKPVCDELIENIKKRGLQDSLMIGICSDVRAATGVVELWKKLLPGARWVIHSHGLESQLRGVPVGYSATVWKNRYAADPEAAHTYGWRRGPGTTIVAQFNRDLVFGWVLTQNKLMPENNIGGAQRGFGRNGADFFPPYRDKKGRRVGMLAGRYLNGWNQLSLKTCFLSPGPDGALGTIRFEMTREGVQECEARIFIEKVLLDKAQRAKLGEEKAKKIQELLDDRIRAGLWGKDNYGWYVSSGWQDRSAKLYATAAEVAGVLNIHQQFLALRLEAAAGKRKEAAAKCRAYLKEHAAEAHFRGIGLSYLAEIAGEEAFDELCAAAEGADPVIPGIAVRALATLSGEGVTQKLITRAGTTQAATRATYLKALGIRGDKAGLAVVRENIKDENEGVRLAALAAVRPLVGAEAIPDLLEAVKTGTPAVREIARRELGQLPDKEVAAALAAALPEAPVAFRVGLLRLLAVRNVRDAKRHIAVVLAEMTDLEQQRVGPLLQRDLDSVLAGRNAAEHVVVMNDFAVQPDLGPVVAAQFENRFLRRRRFQRDAQICRAVAALEDPVEVQLPVSHIGRERFPLHVLGFRMFRRKDFVQQFLYVQSLPGIRSCDRPRRDVTLVFLDLGNDIPGALLRICIRNCRDVLHGGFDLLGMRPGESRPGVHHGGGGTGAERFVFQIRRQRLHHVEKPDAPDAGQDPQLLIGLFRDFHAGGA
ncbi:HEAT repeat domain-containing protein [Planctomycetota bacterium]